MKKRALSLFATILIAFTGLTARLFYLSVLPKEASLVSSARERTLATSRATIYDRNLNPVVNNDFSYIAIIRPTADALAYLADMTTDYATREALIKGQLTVTQVSKAENYRNCDDIKPLKIHNRYADNSLVHILGYTNISGDGVTGIEKYYNEYLKSKGGELTVAYTADAQGRLLLDEKTEIRNKNYYSAEGLILTIDKDFQLILENALEKNNIKKGAGIIIDTESGEILACASTPVYNRNNLSASLNDSSAPFINRAFSQYPVGSVFKVITAAACIENGTILPFYNCTGSVKKTENIFYCNNLEGHGEIDFNTALSKSCNTYFIEAGIQCGGNNILSLAKSFKLGQCTDLGNGYMTDTGTLPTEKELKFYADIANFSFGQGKLTATPLQIACVFATLANNGIYNTPTLIKGFKDTNGNIVNKSKKASEEILKPSTCQIINTALKQTVIDGTGKSARSKYFDSYCKTSTAQSGQFDISGNEIKYCWFVGSFPEIDPQYTICIMKEDGISGGNDCGPVFKEIAEKIM